MHPKPKPPLRGHTAAPGRECHFLWGYHPVREAMQAGRRTMRTIFFVPDKHNRRVDELEIEARRRAIPCRQTTPDQMMSMVGHDRHQGVIADVSAYPQSNLTEILNLPPVKGRGRLILLLDQVVDPQNFGAIARTAYCSGVQAMVLPKKRSAPPSSAAVTASAGALEHLHLAYVSNLVNAINILKENDLWIVGADRQGQTDLFDSDLAMPMALVIGGEEKGIRPLVKQHCDFLISIPQLSPFNSLNASVAAAVILYESFRQWRVKTSEPNANKK